MECPLIEDNSTIEFALILKVLDPSLGRGPYPEDASNMLMDCTPTSGHIYAGTDEDVTTFV